MTRGSEYPIEKNDKEAESLSENSLNSIKVVYPGKKDDKRDQKDLQDKDGNLSRRDKEGVPTVEDQIQGSRGVDQEERSIDSAQATGPSILPPLEPQNGP